MPAAHDAPPTRRHDARRIAHFGVRTIAAVLSLTVFVLSGVAWAAFRSVSENVTSVAFTPTKAGKHAPTSAGKDMNILLLGDDSRTGASQAELHELGTTDDNGDNTDTIMLLHLPADGRSASLMSFPRDALVTAPGGSGQVKINSIYTDYGGANGLAAVITQLTDLPVTHFMKIGLIGFYRVSNAIGGIDIDMCEAQNLSTDSDSQHPHGYTGINLKQGWNRDVKGRQAVAFVRQRHGPGLSDYTRVARQRYFLAAAFKKVDTAATITNPGRVKSLLDAVSSSLTVDSGLNSGAKLLTVADQMRSLAARNFTLATIPMIGAKYAGADYVGEVIDTDAMPAFIDTFVGQPTAYETARTVSPSQVSVTVLNGGRANGSAGAAAAALSKLGFQARDGQQDASSAATVIAYPDGMQAQAKTLAAMVPGATPVLTHTVSAIELILGASDAGHVSTLPAPVSSTAGTSGTGASGTPAVSTAADTDCVK